MTNGERVVASAFDEMEFAIWQAPRDVFCQPVGEGSILCSVPKRDRHPHFLQPKSPGRRVNFGIGHDSDRGRTPRLARALETDFERAGLAQDVGVARLEKL